MVKDLLTFFNYFLYDGEQIIKSEWLKELDRSSVAFMYDEESKSSEAILRFRDVFKLYSAKQDKNATYLLIGIEDQTTVNYAMPVRNMLYDAATYSKQVDEIAKQHRRESRDKGISQGEFLTGFYRKDCLLPVITLVLYWSPDKWDGPRSIHDMLKISNKRILECIPNYCINIISPGEIADKDFCKLHTQLSEALQFIKYSKNKDRLLEILHERESFHHLDRKTAEVLTTVTNIKVTFPKEEKEADMCKAIEDMKREARDKTLMDSIRNLMETMKLTADQAMEALKIPSKDQKRFAKML